MSKLIAELKQEHSEIKNILAKLHDNILPREKKIELLLKAKTLLSEHLAKEDKQLYPFLYEKAKTDFFLKNTLHIFAKDTTKVSNLINDFFDKYSQKKTVTDTEFIKDISQFIVSLKNRLIKEEIGIYQSFEKLQTY